MSTALELVDQICNLAPNFLSEVYLISRDQTKMLCPTALLISNYEANIGLHKKMLTLIMLNILCTTLLPNFYPVSLQY